MSSVSQGEHPPAETATRVVGHGGKLSTEQVERLFRAVDARMVARGWPISGPRRRMVPSTYYNLRDGDLVLASSLPKINDRMEWTDDSAQRVAYEGGEPTPLELLPERLQEAVEARCAQRGWDPAQRVQTGTWAALCDPDPATRRLPGAQALADLDADMEWVGGASGLAAREGTRPLPLEGAPTEVVVRLAAPPADGDRTRWFIVAGEATQEAAGMDPATLGRLTAVVEQLVEDWRARRGR